MRLLFYIWDRGSQSKSKNRVCFVVCNLKVYLLYKFECLTELEFFFYSTTSFMWNHCYLVRRTQHHIVHQFFGSGGAPFWPKIRFVLMLLKILLIQL